MRVQSKYCGPACVSAARRSQPRAYNRVAPGVQSALRAALEAEDWDAVLAAVKANVVVTASGCWEWQGRRTAKGYPTFNRMGRTVQVHRLVLEAKWRMPLGKQQAHHKCANPPCVRPDHLMPVTHADNQVEMRQRLSYEHRIAMLEDALRKLAPGHPYLTHIPTGPMLPPVSAEPMDSGVGSGVPSWS